MIFSSPRQQFHLIICRSITLFYSSQYPPTSSQLAQTLACIEGVAMRCECLLPNMAFMWLHYKYLGTSVKVKVYINLVRSLCFYDGIARLSLPRMLAWRQTLPKVLHRWNYIVYSLQQFHLIITWNMPFILLYSSLCPLTSSHSSQLPL